MTKKTGSLFLLFFLWGAFPALCQEYLMAEVVSVNPGKMEIVVIAPADPDRFVTVQVADKNNLPRNGSHVYFPGCVTSGATIRLWGKSTQMDSSLFVATDIRGWREEGCGADPTGVRSRLRKSQRNHMEDDSPGRNFDLDSDKGGSSVENGPGNGGGGGGNGGGGGGGR